MPRSSLHNQKRQTDNYWSHSAHRSAIMLYFLLQDTLEEANALLNELEARDARQAPQVTGSSSSDKTQTYENSSMESNTNQSSLDRIEG